MAHIFKIYAKTKTNHLMKTFAEKIRTLLSRDHKQVMPLPIDFVKNKKSMLKELRLSKQSGNAIGVYSKAMGEGMFLTAVEQVEPNGLIVFSRYDMSGAILNRYELTLEEIQIVCPTSQRYRHPLLTRQMT